jgi:putative SOS response-associated peptidase YedK
MCGRFTQTRSRIEILEELGKIELPPLFERRYNIAPTQKIVVLRQDSAPRAEELIWGFDPPHAGSPVINARSETLTERPMFKNLCATNRCLIPADGFFEWKGRQPCYFQLPQKQLFAFAGLWRNDRCVILTRAADNSMQGIHHRMPVILTKDQWRPWFSAPSAVPVSRFGTPPALSMRPVSHRVNSAAHDDPACLAPADVQGELF